MTYLLLYKDLKAIYNAYIEKNTRSKKRKGENVERTILHSDANCFYASVEMLYHPEYVGKPLAVGGDPEARHGIVLTANYIAKRSGVKTGIPVLPRSDICTTQNGFVLEVFIYAP